MKVVILDGFTANPGDLSWDGLKQFGELKVYERTKPEELLERAKGAEVLLTNKVIIDADAMAALPDLRYIGVLATGLQRSGHRGSPSPRHCRDEHPSLQHNVGSPNGDGTPSEHH